MPGGEDDDGAPHVRRRGPDGQVFFASLAGNYLGQIDLETGATTVLEGKSGPARQTGRGRDAGALLAGQKADHRGAGERDA